MQKKEQNIDVYEITFSSPEYASLGEYIIDPGSPAFPNDISNLPKKDKKVDYRQYAEQFADYKNSDGVTNREKIVEKYINIDDTKRKEYLTKYPAYDLPLKVGTRLVVPIEDINRGGLLTQGIEVVSNNEPAFKAAMLVELENDKGWERITPPIENKIDMGIVKETYPNITVWAWCRSLSSQQSNDLQGEIFNLTPFIQSLTTNTGKNGSNFQLSLAPIVCERDKKTGKWILKKSQINFGSDTFHSNSSLFSNQLNQSGKFLKRNQFFFHNVLSSNDLLFIRFETLKMEEQYRVSDSKDLIIDKNRIPNKIYDLIGLVDSNSITIIHNENTNVINISGRDLSKLFIEDGTYFYSLEASKGNLFFAGGATAGENELLKRLIADSSLLFFKSYFNNSIERVLEFIIQQLSTISIVPNDLFEAYKDRRNTKTINKENVKYAPFVEELKQREKLAKRLIRETRKIEGITDVDYYKENQKIEVVYSEIKKFLRAAQESISSTTGNSALLLSFDGRGVAGWSNFNYVFDETLPPESVPLDVLPTTFANQLLSIKKHVAPLFRSYETNGIINTIYEVIALEDSKSEYQPLPKRELADGIWQIVKLVIDFGVTKRRIVDSSMSSAQGSLLNFIRKCCQEPFVEFYMDTYGDMYYLIVRKPPHDKEGLLSLLGEQSINTDEGYSNSAVINIEEIDVINENLNFNDEEAYSWYSFTPQGNFLGSAQQFSLAYIPAIFFKEYAEIWGSRPFNTINNYTPYLPLDKQNKDSLSLYEKQAFYDMQYLIESHQYLPFTRKGVITLNGDRRIKIGNIIRYKPTGEIFFVDSVQQNYSISTGQVERTTTVSVSRGMVEALIYGVNALDEDGNAIPGKKVSYFNIINTELNFKEKEVDNIIQKEVEEGESDVSDIEQGVTSSSPWLYEMIKKSEGYRSKPYVDPKGQSDTYSIGYGSQFYPDGRRVGPNDPPIDKNIAENILQSDIVKRERAVLNKFRGHPLTQNQFDSILDYYYTTGEFFNNWYNTVIGYLEGSVTEQELKNVWYNSAVTGRGTGIVLQGLVNRRRKEADWFLNRPFGQEKKVKENKKYINVIDPDNPTKKIIDRSQVFSNFKVNKEVFNFFLRKEQFNYIDEQIITEGGYVYG